MLGTLLAVRLGLGLLLGEAAFSKLADLRRFGRVVESYRLLPARVSLATATSVVGMEGALAGLLLAGWQSRLTAGITSGVITTFAGVLASSVLRGNPIDCGCGVWATNATVSWWQVARNLGIASAAAVLAIAPPPSLGVVLRNHHIHPASLLAIAACTVIFLVFARAFAAFVSMTSAARVVSRELASKQ